MSDQHQPTSDLKQIRIIMVGTTHPGNIGAAARAMHNMCFDQLVLVDPLCKVGETAYARSSGAHAILDNRRTVNRLEEAIDDCHLVLGLTARQRSLSWPQLEPDEVAAKMFELGKEARLALVFGRENSGLSNDELALCHYMVSIPTNPDFSSLNVASAIQVICYEIFKTFSRSKPQVRSDTQEPLATAKEVEGYFSHLQQVMTQTGFLDNDNPGLLMQRLRRLYQRLTLSKTEVNILRGILTSVQKHKS